jgi:flagella basal body P-ring formation protein FlgA
MPLPLLLAACLAVNAASDRITAADLVPAFPGMESVAPETPLGLAPGPGATRLFRSGELEKIASRFGLQAPGAEICLERRIATLEPASLLAAMQAALPDARIQILEFSRRPVPEGSLVFPLTGLHEGPAGAFWDGSVRYAGNRSVPIWARVTVSVQAPRVVALEDLPAGKEIDAGIIRAEMRDEFRTAADFSGTPEQVVGKSPRALIRAGTSIRLRQLVAPTLVRTGDTVHVDAFDGGAHLQLDARAEASGTLGQTISVRNLDSQKQFSARVEAKGRVSVNASFGRDNR